MPDAPERRDLQLPIERVTADLRRRIDAGEWKPGERIPSTADLARQLHASRATIGNAIKALTAERKLVTRHRWGTFIPPEAGSEAR